MREEEAGGAGEVAGVTMAAGAAAAAGEAAVAAMSKAGAAEVAAVVTTEAAGAEVAEEEAVEGTTARRWGMAWDDKAWGGRAPLTAIGPAFPSRRHLDALAQPTCHPSKTPSRRAVGTAGVEEGAATSRSTAVW